MKKLLIITIALLLSISGTGQIQNLGNVTIANQIQGADIGTISIDNALVTFNAPVAYDSTWNRLFDSGGFKVISLEATDHQLVVPLPFVLKSEHLVFINGDPLPLGYSGINTDTLIFNYALDKYTQIIVISSN